MLIKSTLTNYLAHNAVVWVPSMPVDIPPEEICIPANHVLYRLTKKEHITKFDLLSYYELDPEHDWGDKLGIAHGLSLFDDLSKVNKLIRIPSLKNSKGVSKLTLNAQNGVVKQTTKNHYHYTWWKTSSFDINTVETVMAL